METITLNATENPSRNPQLHVAAAAGNGLLIYKC